MSSKINSTLRKIIGSSLSTSAKETGEDQVFYYEGDKVFFSADDKEIYGQVAHVYPAMHHYMNGKQIDIVRISAEGRVYGPFYSEDRRIRHATHSEIKERRRAERRQSARGIGLIPGLESLIGFASSILPSAMVD